MTRADRVFAALDLGGTQLKTTLITADGVMLGQMVQPSRVAHGPGEVVRHIAAAIRDLKTRSLGPSCDAIAGIGLAVCCPVDHRSKLLTESSGLPGWKDVPLGQLVETATQLPVTVDNDANFAALGEWWKGAGEHCDVLAGLTLGTGVGGGIVHLGKIFHGGSGFASEFGRLIMPVFPADPLAAEHRHLGGLGSAKATLRRYAMFAAAGSAPIGDVAALNVALRLGDEAATKALAFSVDYLSYAVGTIVQAIGPSVVVLTGGLAELGETVAMPIRRYIRDLPYSRLWERTEVRVGCLGLFAGCYGAAKLASQTADRAEMSA